MLFNRVCGIDLKGQFCGVGCGALGLLDRYLLLESVSVGYFGTTHGAPLQKVIWG
jgi:hypothetical protein